MAKDVAIVVGVGAGLGAALCRRFVEAGLLVAAAARDKERLTALAKEVGAHPYPADTTDEGAVRQLFAAVQRDLGDPSLVVYNASAFLPKAVVDTEPAEFERCWRVGCFGGFLAGREAARHLVPLGRGTIIFTGASASLRGKPGYAHFAAAKAGLRMIAQSMAREYGRLGIHVAHVVIDGGIDGERLRKFALARVEERGEDGLLGIDAIAETFWHIHRQPRSAWAQEIDLRPFKETF